MTPRQEALDSSIQLLLELVAPVEYLLVDERKFVYAAIFDLEHALESVKHGFKFSKDSERNRIGEATDEQIAIFKTIEILRKELHNAN
jgi:hypothetical protein